MKIWNKISGLFHRNSGKKGESAKLTASGAGILLVLLILLIFVLAATWLMSVFAGLLCAYLFLPLEGFFERIVRLRFFKIFSLPFLPMIKLKALLTRKNKKDPPTAEEIRKKQIDSLTMKSAALTVLFVTALVVLLLTVAVMYFFPFALEKGNQAANWVRQHEVVQNLDQRLAESPADGSTTMADMLQELLKEDNLIRFSRNLNLSIASDFTDWLLSFLSALGSFAVDLLMFVFFFFFFLQKMAAYRLNVHEEHPAAADNVGRWVVSSVLKSGWLPAFSETAREHAEKILRQIFRMFDAWLRGYVTIILVETFLYCTFFLLFQVPYAIPLGIIAGLTILLPFLGPLVSFLLTLAVTIAFAPVLTFPVTGVCITYLLINGLLEQFFLYPVLVGEAIGLTTAETIIGVLAGAAIAGISGMILAVPAAALLKLLVPLVYNYFNNRKNDPENGSKELL